MVIVANVGILFHFYESLYVAQTYTITLLGFWFFGISLHSLVPVLMTIANAKVVRRFLKKSPYFWPTTLATWLFCLFFIGYVSYRFNQVNTVVSNSFHQRAQPHEDHSLPPWLSTSQQLPKDWITKLALKSDLAYSTRDDLFSSFGSFGPRRLNERIKHDPLVVIASFFNQGIDIPFGDRIKILRYMFDARHSTERKLWSGDNLSTTDIVTNVQLFPAYHLAYTEKTFKIHNSVVSRWRQQQEAFYTFYLPEGSVVTSAALWVEGEERPAYLTTKSKADSAYQAIVGVERRDPLLLHWQEGNRVTLRVFPCTPKEDRQFKIGITTPLHKIDNQLLYKNIDFEGPYWSTANESINIVTEGALTNMDAPFSFQEDGLNYTYSGPYNSRWSLTFDAPELSSQTFSFNNKSYQLSDHNEVKETFNPEHIYLDINAGFSKSELSKIWAACQGKEVFVYSNHKMTKVTEGNKKVLFRQQCKQNFTLFPFYKMDASKTNLVISKFNQLTPTLEDIKSSDFMKRTSSFFGANQSAVRLYNIGEDASPYLRTLQELRSIQMASGSVNTLVDFIKENTFYKNQENEQTIVNRYGGFQLKESNDATSPTQAPDHLMRLFVYNDLLRELGKDYFNKKALANNLITAAKEAYVVSPISSLIVLETQKDYDRFNIEKAKNSLQNASIGDSGAVPEPGEWLLILLVLTIVLWMYFGKGRV
jgi:XrtN system VIT domain protein